MNDYQRRELSISRLGKFFFVLLGLLAVSGAACTSPEQTTEEAIAAGSAELRAQAEQGNAEALYNLGFMYANGEGVPQDDAEARVWYRRAAEQGHVQAQLNVGGEPVDDSIKAERVTESEPEELSLIVGAQQEDIDELRTRAEAGDAEAQNDLGVIYDNGNVLPQNLVQAAAWYRKAAEQGDSRAQANLGFMYATGRGVPRNDVEAVAWYRKGAAQGHRVSKSFLDRMYEGRRGVSEDDAEFIEWLSAAEGQDNAGGEPVDDSVKAEFAILRVAVWDDGLAAGGTALIDLDA